MYDDGDTRCSRSDARLDLMCEHMGTGMLVVGDEGRILFVNRAAASVLGLTQDDLNGNVYELVPEAAFLFSGDASRYQGRERITLRDGPGRTVEFTSERIEDRRLVLLWDSGKVEYEEERRNRAEHLAVMRKLAARLNHEIKNPLASVLAGLQTLETGSSICSDDLFMLRLVLEEVRSVNRIVKGAMDSIRTDITRPESVSVERLLRTAVETLIPDARERNVSFRIVPGKDGGRVFVDEHSMERAVGNLLKNALESTSDGGAISTGWRTLGESEKGSVLPGYVGAVVAIYGQATGRSVAGDPANRRDLSVTTEYEKPASGSGQSSPLRKRGDRGDSRVKAGMPDPAVSSKRSGMGLEVSVAQEIVELHGGVLLPGRSTGGGMTFEVLMPAHDAVSGIPPAAAGSCEPAPTKRECAECTMKSDRGPDLCWVVKGLNHRNQTGAWPGECLKCSVFRSRNLLSYVDRGSLSGKDK